MKFGSSKSNVQSARSGRHTKAPIRSAKPSTRSLVFLAMASMPVMAQAQVASQLTPPMRTTLDSNGVDLSSLQVTLPIASVSIGGIGGVSHAVVLRNGTFFESSVGYIRNGVGTVTVVIGASSEVFYVSGTTFTPQEGRGSTLSLAGTTYTYTKNDGTLAEFSTALVSASDILTRFNPAAALITKERDRDGTTRTFTYDTGQMTSPGGRDGPNYNTVVRLRLIASNLGYTLIFRYFTDQIPPTLTGAGGVMLLTNVNAYNSNVDSCTAVSCTTTGVRPSLTVSNSTSGSVTYTDVLNRTTQVTSVSGSLKIRRPSSPTVDNYSAVLNGSSQVTSVLADGVTTNYGFTDLSGVRTVTVARNGQPARTLTFNIASGLVNSDSNELGKKTDYAYSSLNQLTDIQYPEGNKTHYTVDPRGNVTETRAISKTPGTPPDVVTSATFPATCTNYLICNQKLSETDAKGNVTNYEYNTAGMITKATAPAPLLGAVRPETRYDYALIGTGSQSLLMSKISACQSLAPTQCIATADEVTVQVNTFDSNGRPTSVKSQAGDGSVAATTAIAYNATGDRLSVDGALPGTADTEVLRYDAARQLVGVIHADPDGAGSLQNSSVRITYNLDGQVTRQEAGTTAGQTDAAWSGFSTRNQTDVSYDANGREATRQLGAGGTAYALTHKSYDTSGRVDCTAVRMNPGVYGSLPASACTLSTQGSNGSDQIVKVAYDAASQPIQRLVAYGTVDQAADATLGYSNNGKVTSLLDGMSNKTTYVYDGLDRLSQTQYPSTTQGVGTSNSANYEQLSYDANSNIASVRRRDGRTFSFAYDALNRATSKIVPDGCAPSQQGVCPSALATRDLYYSYDLLGRLLGARFDSASGADAVTMAYDALGRMTSSTTSMGGFSKTLGSQFDVAGNRTRLTHPDGTYFSFGYDALNRLGTGSWTNGGGTTAFLTNSYDSLGRKTGIARGASSSISYSFDAVSRVSSIAHGFTGAIGNVTSTLGYTPSSQIASETRDNDAFAWAGGINVNRGYNTNGLNQYTLSGTATPTYDTNGNLIGDGTSSYGYDAENRLISMSNGASLSYDPLGRLWQVTSTTTNNRFLYDGDQLALEYDVSGNVAKRYAFGDQIDQPVFEDSGGALACGTTTRFLNTDIRGSVIAQADCAGNRTAINAYDEYGIPAATNTGRFQYTGQAWLPELGMYYYKARIYSPTLGRFMQTDPIGVNGGINIYAYAGNDPVNRSDPSGLVAPIQGPDITVTGPSRGWFSWGDFFYHDFFSDRRFDGIRDGGRMGADGGGKPQSTWGHSYKPYNQISDGPCNLSDSERRYLAQHFSTPFSAGTAAVNGRVTLFGTNPIAQRITNGGFTVVNQTLPGHAFHSNYGGGSVTRTTLIGENGALYTSTIGQGTNYSRFEAGFNQLTGPMIFSALDSAMAAYVKESGICN